VKDQTKDDIKLGDSECKPVPRGTKVRVNGQWETVICTMDGFNVTWRLLKNLITDTPAPITLPLKTMAQAMSLSERKALVC